ncbi:MAG: hypothetical protein QXQ65_06300 [Conexivisphaerales archaeon]
MTSALTAIYIMKIVFICEADNRFVNVRLQSAWIAGSLGRPILYWDN